MDRPIIVVPKKRWGFKSKAEKWGVAKSTEEPQRRDFIFLGTGRTGSTHIAAVMQHWGFDVLHERTGKHGTSTHFYHSDHYWYPMYPWTKGLTHVGERASDFLFNHWIHVVRDPLTCIPSIMAIFTTLEWEFAEETGLLPMDSRGLTKMQRVMAYWLNLNLRAMELCDTTIKLEQLPIALPLLIKKTTGKDVQWPDIKPKNRGTGFRRSEPTNYSTLHGEDPRIARAIYRMAKGFGYVSA